MASTAMHPLFFNDESVSLRSFRVNASPPSLKASSLKVKGSLALSNLLGSRGRTTEKYPQPTLRDLTEASYKEADQAAHFLLTSPESSKMPRMNVNSNAEVQTEQATLQRPRSKSRTIIRMLTTKFTPRAVSSPTVVRPPPTPNAYSKDQRDAALRERGLLPPLRPNKDLSAQEFEQDQHIPIVEPVEESDGHSEEAVPSAADLVKKEWVAKNHGVEAGQRARMNSFKFGGGSSPVASSPSEENRLPSPLAAEDQVPSSMADKPTSPPNGPLPPVPFLPEEPVPQQPTSSSMNALSIPLSAVESMNRPPSPLFELSTEIQAFMFPLPPTPSISTTELAFPPRPPTALVPPRSPSLRSLPDTPQSVKSSAGGSGANTPRPLEVPEMSTLTQSTAPLISLTPATEISLPPTETAPANDTLSSAFHIRTDSFAQLEESISSDTTPSLDSTSQTTANSTTGTTDHDSASNSSSAAKGPGKLGMLQVKTHGATIPVIVESPVQMTRFSEELAVVVEESPSMEFDEFNEKSENPIVVAAVVPQSTTAPTPLAPGLRPPKRGSTDPTGTVDRRKSLNPFKRDRAVSSTAGAEPQRRLSMATSLSNMRRSVVGTISGGSGKKFNASNLPPSPTVPSGFAGSRASTLGSRSPPPTPRARQAVAPVMYNRGSILMETAGIEDEESRRMTELAFLG